MSEKNNNNPTKKEFPRPPINATTRLQFHKGFTFDDAADLVDYFSDLGISHVYASPILTARQESTHGYDIVDPTLVNSEIGGIEGLRRLVSRLREANMGLIIDIVPNHMGVGGSENPWWQHVFEWGHASPYAHWFDIDWFSRDPQLHNKILAPFLGDAYGMVLEKGDLQLRFSEKDGRILLQYFTNHFPIALADYSSILKHADSPLLEPAIALLEAIDYSQNFIAIENDVDKALDAMMQIGREEAGRRAIDAALEYYNSGTSEGQEALHQLLERQHYRLTWWRNAADEINWRRFFEVSELAGVRVELEEVFEATHSLIFDLYAEGLIDGLRLDHIDGLAQPREYCHRLRARLESLIEKRPQHLRFRPYIVAEKILAPDEWLRQDWGLDGTTGYEFMDQVSAVLHDPRGAEPLANLWRNLTGDQYDFPRHVQNARRQLLSENLVGEFEATAWALHSIARADLHTRDYSIAAMKRVLTEILVHFPVYRSYVTAQGPDAGDREIFELTAANAKRTLSHVDKPVVDTIFSWLSAEPVINPSSSEIADLCLRAITRFQQLTPPLSAKSGEDTAFYRYGRLLSRNEVGSDPGHFSLSVADFHQACGRRLQTYPQTLIATATHDHKRGEDVRSRISVLSQVAPRWGSALAEWLQMNARFHHNLHPDDNPSVSYNAPRPWHEVMLYQMLVGAWPYELTPQDSDGIRAFAERLDQWQLKSIREAKRMSTWMQANEPYENACREFLFNILDTENNGPFLHSLYEFIQEIEAGGALNSLAQTLLRLTTPGIPDLYQGTELWDLTLVDPDNRRPVDYAKRHRMLREKATLDDKVRNWRSGELKQHILRDVLRFRREQPDLFLRGSYMPLEAAGPRAAHVIAFMRTLGDQSIIVIVPRLTQFLLAPKDGPVILPEKWQGTQVILPDKLNADVEDALSGKRYPIYGGQIPLDQALSLLSVAMLSLKITA